MKSPLKNLKKYFQLIMTALICFVMGVIEDKKRICIKDTDSKKTELFCVRMIKRTTEKIKSFTGMNHESKIE